jgi:transposase
MARKSYSEEFKRDAVALYRDTEGATLTAIAADLGITDATLSSWCKAGGVPIRHRRPGSTPAAPVGAETAEQELARLRSEVGDLRAEHVKLATERDILRAAAKYFAGETNW